MSSETELARVRDLLTVVLRDWHTGHGMHWDEQGRGGASCPACALDREARGRLRALLDSISGPPEMSDARVLALHMANWIVQQPSGVDHACSRCIPGGEAVVPGFMCARHVAMGLMAAAGNCVDCGRVATRLKCGRGPESGHQEGTPLCETHACPQCTPITAGATRT